MYSAYRLQYKLQLLLSRMQITVTLDLQEPTRSSAIAEGPRDALCQLKSCQLMQPMHNCMKSVVVKFELFERTLL